MTSYDYGFHLSKLSNEVKQLKEEVCELQKKVDENEIWDNADMMQKWKVSLRTLASWRSENLIDYVQVGAKIWYTNEARDKFLKNNLKVSNNGN